MSKANLIKALKVAFIHVDKETLTQFGVDVTKLKAPKQLKLKLKK